MYVEKGCTKYTFTKPEEFSQAGELTVTCLHKLNQAYTKVFFPSSRGLLSSADRGSHVIFKD